MSVVLLHKTAWLVYHASKRPVPMKRFPSEASALETGYPSQREVARVRGVLKTMGIPARDLECIDVLVSQRSKRSRDPSVTSHYCAFKLPARSICRIAPAIFVVCPELCFIQMATVFEDRRELVEWGYELCGGYELPIGREGDYRERSPLTCASGIMAIAASVPGMHGSRRVRWAVKRIRDGSCSPMETAHAMTLALPRSEGGLGVRELRMDYRIDIPDSLRHLTTKSHVVCDACVPKARLDSEYNGFHHDEERRKVEDEERRNVLEAMGFRVKVLTKAAFFGAAPYRRYLQSIMRILGMRSRDLPQGFWGRQEELRRFVLRRWL